jgi:hypothetical protein
MRAAAVKRMVMARKEADSVDEVEREDGREAGGGESL